jgi:hypothetical protein
MIPLVDQTLWMVTMLVEAFVVCLFFVQGLSSRFFFFNAYFLLSVLIGIGRYIVVMRSGVSSYEYAYLYFYSDGLLSFFLFLSLFEIGAHLDGAKMLRSRNLLLSVGTLLATALFSFEITSVARFRARYFVFEFSHNIYAVSCLVIAILWIRKLGNDPKDPTAARFVNVLSVYFSLFLLDYGVSQFTAQDFSLMNSLGPMTGAWLPLGCGFALVQEQPPGINR